MIANAIALLCLISMVGVAGAETFRCGSKLVMEGDSSAAVIAKCGSPTWVDQAPVTGPSAAESDDQQSLPVSLTDENLVDTWIYNFGPNRLMMRVHIENGTVVQIDAVGYGYSENR
jgi:hypothetical protein